MLNRVVLIGRLTHDPELKFIPSGTAVAHFSIAVDRNFTNKDGEREADFVRIVAWRKLAETCANYLGKGRLVAVEGRLQIRNYEQDGQKRTIAEVVADSVQFLDRGNQSPQQKGGSNEQRGSNSTGFDQYGTDVNIDDDDIPF
jgi:single-strand DNA-binding protein